VAWQTAAADEQEDDGEEEEEDDEEALALALQMSMAESAGAAAGASGGLDADFVNQLLGSVGVDQNDPLMQAALEQLAAEQAAKDDKRPNPTRRRVRGKRTGTTVRREEDERVARVGRGVGRSDSNSVTDMLAN
jgi:hypothetical protein